MTKPTQVNLFPRPAFPVLSGERAAIIPQLLGISQEEYLRRKAEGQAFYRHAKANTDPAQTGIAPGMRAMKARLAKRAANGKRPVGTAARAHAPQPRGSRRVDVVARLQRALDRTAPTAAQSPALSPTRTTRGWSVACHEAAHAVVADRLGLTVTAVRCLNADEEGYCLIGGGTHLDVATVAMAGTLAQDRADGGVHLPSDGDEQCIRESIRREHPGYHDGARRDAARSACRANAKRLVGQHWATIYTLADELYSAGEIRGKRLADLLH